MHQLLILAAALVATTAYAGMYDQPYALVERGAASKPARRRRSPSPRWTAWAPATRARPIRSRRASIASRFTSRARAASFRPEFQDIELDLEACTRYRVVASYELKTGPDWKPRVYAEPIGECRKKFPTPQAPAK
ncbi:MAG: hypothetical protein IPG28_19150 [Betaproteobacteria bacterium]|nr:hypothetical protein [Betaproteobacteria bacterium]